MALKEQIECSANVTLMLRVMSTVCCVSLKGRVMAGREISTFQVGASPFRKHFFFFLYANCYDNGNVLRNFCFYLRELLVCLHE